MRQRRHLFSLPRLVSKAERNICDNPRNLRSSIVSFSTQISRIIAEVQLLKSTREDAPMRDIPSQPGWEYKLRLWQILLWAFASALMPAIYRTGELGDHYVSICDSRGSFERDWLHWAGVLCQGCGSIVQSVGVVGYAWIQRTYHY
jgi:hypothetical protein